MEISCEHTSDCPENHFCDRGPFMCRTCSIICDIGRGTTGTCKKECPEYWSIHHSSSVTSPAHTSQNENEAEAAIIAPLNDAGDGNTYGSAFYVCVAVLTILVIVVIVAVSLLCRRIYRVRKKYHPKTSCSSSSVQGTNKYRGAKHERGNEMEKTSLSSDQANPERTEDLEVGVGEGEANGEGGRGSSAQLEARRKPSQTVSNKTLDKHSQIDAHLENECVQSVREHQREVGVHRSKGHLSHRGKDIVGRTKGSSGGVTEVPAKMSNVVCQEKEGVSGAECKSAGSAVVRGSVEMKTSDNKRTRSRSHSKSGGGGGFNYDKEIHGSKGILEVSASEIPSVVSKREGSAVCKGREHKKTDDIIMSCDTLPKSTDVSRRIQAKYSDSSTSVVSANRVESGSLDNAAMAEVIKSIQIRKNVGSDLEQDGDETSLKQRVQQGNSINQGSGASQREGATSDRVCKEGTQAATATGHPNKEIYNVLRKVDFVQGYFSQGKSIEVYVNLNEIAEDIALREIATRTGAPREKFRLVHESGDY